MRKGIGLASIDRLQQTSQQYASHGSTLRAEHLSSLTTQLSVFQNLLHQFSISHGKEIRSNPAFRAEFARMCNAIGVDPLVSSYHGNGSKSKDGGNFWTQMLGRTVNDFYFEIAVRVVEVCRATKAVNGGLLPVTEARERVAKGRGVVGGQVEISDDDILRAVRSLKPLGSGFSIVIIGQQPMIRSVPKELNTDQATVLEALQVLGYVTVSMLRANLEWEGFRAQTVLEDLLADGLVWIDTQSEDGEDEYWAPMRMV
ncbi:MAG: hypothetical protein M1823_001267 [Watsoniomyces obsoletus]|nr:MAG: hypothetical protein M1823_001267 [Watsoniomyces obsoletus]